jgi:hypothetical protein
VQDACQNASRPGSEGGSAAAEGGVVRYASKAEALAALAEWRRVHTGRDDAIMAAIAVGVGVNEIARVTGTAKTTVLRIRDQREYEARCAEMAAMTSAPGGAARLAAYVREHFPEAAAAAGPQSLLVDGLVDWLGRVADHDPAAIEAAMAAASDGATAP